MRVKVQLGLSENADKFVWRTPNESPYANLIKFITSTFDSISTKSFQIQYKDDEGDLITCSSDSDIRDALNFAKQENLKSLKLFVITDDDNNNDDDNDDDTIDNKENQAISDNDDNDDDDDDDNDDDDAPDQDEQDEDYYDDNEQQQQQILSENAEEQYDENDNEQEQDEEDQVDEEEDEDEDEDAQEEEEEEEEEDEDEEEEEEEEEVEEDDVEIELEIEQPEEQDIIVDDEEEEEEEEEDEEEREIDREQEQEQEQEQEEKEKESIPTIKELLEFIYIELRKNEEVSRDFVVGICSLWPINASYPIHFGAMLQMIIEDKSKQNYYGFITNNKYYNILQNELKQYSGSDIQSQIKQMANLCNTVGSDKFSLLSTNILDAFKNLLINGQFNLDFGPLLKATTPKKKIKTPNITSSSSPITLKQSQQNDDTSSVTSFSAKLESKPKSKSKSKSKSKTKSKSKLKSKTKTNTKSKLKSIKKIKEKEEEIIKEEKKEQKKRILYSHGAYISCSECDMCPIRGPRYVCMVRENYNICQECEEKLINNNKLQYPMIKIYKPRPNWHIKNFKGLQELVAIPDLQSIINPPKQQKQSKQQKQKIKPKSKQKSKQKLKQKQKTKPKLNQNDDNNHNQQETKGNLINVSNINDQSSVLKNFPFMSQEMQTKYMDAMKQFNETDDRKTDNNNISQSQTQSLLLPTDSASQTHSHSPKLDQLNNIPFAKIMPSISKQQQQQQQSQQSQQQQSLSSKQSSAIKDNDQLMAEIDALLKPNKNNKNNLNNNNSMNKQSNQNNIAAMLGLNNSSKPNESSGLDALQFASSSIPSSNINNSSNNFSGNISGGGANDLSGLINLVNQGNNDNNNDIKENNINDNNNNEDYNASVENTQHPGDIATNASATMTWNIKNIGNKSFGDNCKLAFVSGDGLLVSQYHIPNAKPNDIVKISMSFNAFSTPGTYETNFRLCANGKQFGPQLIVKINVIDPNKLMPNPSMHPIGQQPVSQQPVPPQQQQQQQHNKPLPAMQAQYQQAPSRQAPSQQPPSYWGPQPQSHPQSHPPSHPYQHGPPPPHQYPNYYPQGGAGPVPYQQIAPTSVQPAVPQQPQQSQPSQQAQQAQAIQAPIQIEPQREPSPEPIKPKRSSPRSSPKASHSSNSGVIHQGATSLFSQDETDAIESKKDKEKSKGWFGFGGKKKGVTKKESNLSCLCGAHLIYLDVKQAYKGKKVYCDICSKVCKESIFHCPAGDIRSHPGGFDLCYACGGSQLAKQPNPAPDMFLSTDSGANNAQLQAVLAASAAEHANNSNNKHLSYPALKPSAPPAPSHSSSSSNKKSSSSSSSSNDNYDPNFLYPSQLKQLLDMGFDKDKARKLLLKNRGNMSQVLAELIK